MQENGYTVQVEDVNNAAVVKDRYNIPPILQSCHTAIVDGYVLEGHIPAADVARLLQERPNVLGLAVPGMPVGSPGMEVEGVAPQPFDVLTFDADGSTQVFSSYRN